ncbi:hypothetical protein ACX80J_14685 [Arthrobacter sp. MDB2-24]
MVGIFAVAVGFGLSFVPLTLTALTGIRPEDSGIASALLNAAQQIGVALGIAALSTISVTTTESRFPTALAALREARSAGDTAIAATTSQAIVDGYTTALSSGAVILAVAALIVTLLVTARPQGAAKPPDSQSRTRIVCGSASPALQADQRWAWNAERRP